jgi:hypothetical protein
MNLYGSPRFNFIFMGKSHFKKAIPQGSGYASTRLWKPELLNIKRKLD